MFDIGMPEMLVIIVVTLVVVGPKELPRVVRAIAAGMAKLRAVMFEFRSGVNEFIRESELADLQEAIDKTRAAMDDPDAFGEFVDPTGPAPSGTDGATDQTKQTKPPSQSAQDEAPKQEDKA